MYALLVPVGVIVLDTILAAFNAQETNPIVGAIDSFADAFTFEVFETMFPRQSYVQTALVALAVYGVVAVLVVLLFKVLRAVLSGPSKGKSKA